MRAIRLAGPIVLALLVIGGIVAGVVVSSSGGSKKHHDCTAAEAAAGKCVNAGSALAASGTGATGASGATYAKASTGASGAKQKGSSPAAGVPGGVAGSADAPASGGANGGAGGSQGAGGSHGAAGSGQGRSGGGGPAGSVVGNAQPGSASGSAVFASDGTLASGRSETGAWEAVSVLNTEIEPTVTAGMIKFPVPLSNGLGELGVTYIAAAEAARPGSARGAAIRAACGDSGTVAAPTANPGHLCVYSGLEDFRDRDPSGGIPTRGSGGTGGPFEDGQFVAIFRLQRDTPGTNRTGARVAFGVPDLRTSEEMAKNAYPHILAHGSWAVSAP